MILDAYLTSEVFMDCKTRLSPVCGIDDVGPLTASWAPAIPSGEVHAATKGPLASTATCVVESQVASMQELCFVVNRSAVTASSLRADGETTPWMLFTGLVGKEKELPR